MSFWRFEFIQNTSDMIYCFVSITRMLLSVFSTHVTKKSMIIRYFFFSCCFVSKHISWFIIHIILNDTHLDGPAKTYWPHTRMLISQPPCCHYYLYFILRGVFASVIVFAMGSINTLRQLLPNLHPSYKGYRTTCRAVFES